jgi:hypothetical protein
MMMKSLFCKPAMRCKRSAARQTLERSGECAIWFGERAQAIQPRGGFDPAEEIQWAVELVCDWWCPASAEPQSILQEVVSGFSRT